MRKTDDDLVKLVLNLEEESDFYIIYNVSCQEADHEAQTEQPCTGRASRASALPLAALLGFRERKRIRRFRPHKILCV